MDCRTTKTECCLDVSNPFLTSTFYFFFSLSFLSFYLSMPIVSFPLLSSLQPHSHSNRDSLGRKSASLSVTSPGVRHLLLTSCAPRLSEGPSLQISPCSHDPRRGGSHAAPLSTLANLEPTDTAVQPRWGRLFRLGTF